MAALDLRNDAQIQFLPTALERYARAMYHGSPNAFPGFATDA